LIYAMIRLGQPELLATALGNPHPGVRKAAVIALDQMDHRPLRREQLAPLLADADPAVRRAAFWVAARHPDWSGTVLEFVRDRLNAPELSAAELNSLREALQTFVNDPAAQTAIAGLVREATFAAERRVMLLAVMEAAALKKFPSDWLDVLRATLADPDLAVRLRTVALIRARALPELDGDLRALAADGSEPADLRIAALGALLPRTPRLDDAAFALLTDPLQPEAAPRLRSAAAQALGRARLTDGQLVTLARTVLPQADVLILPSLLEPFRGTNGEPAGRALVEALSALTTGLDALGGGRLEEIIAAYPDPVKRAAAPLLKRVRANEAGRVQRLHELEALLAGGDVGRGRAVFFGQKAACASCHAIGAEGGTFGPDLTSIGAIRSGRDILEAIVFPSATQVPGYETFRVETADDLHTGIIADESADAVVLRPAANAELRLPREAIRTLTPGPLSLMPEGLDAVLTREELRDLLGFLQSQNGEQWLQPQRLGTQDLRRQAARPPGDAPRPAR
jgi:putative heme-binding domain-containing protein